MQQIGMKIFRYGCPAARWGARLDAQASGSSWESVMALGLDCGSDSESATRLGSRRRAHQRNGVRHDHMQCTAGAGPNTRVLNQGFVRAALALAVSLYLVRI